MAAVDVIAWRDRTKAFEGLAAFTGASCVLTGSAGAEEDPCEVIESRLFPLLGVTPFIGRTFTAEEDQANGARAVILSYGLWQRRFGADPAAIGRAIEINGSMHTIVGVMPRRVLAPLLVTVRGRPAAVDFGYRPAADKRVERLPGGRTFQTRRDTGICAGGARRRVRTGGAGAPGPERLARGLYRAAGRKRRRHGAGAAGARRRGRLRAADRVRQRREPAAGARHRTRQRDGGAQGARRRRAGASSASC